jgi:hypothetical protein
LKYLRRSRPWLRGRLAEPGRCAWCVPGRCAWRVQYHLLRESLETQACQPEPRNAGRAGRLPEPPPARAASLEARIPPKPRHHNPCGTPARSITQHATPQSMCATPRHTPHHAQHATPCAACHHTMRSMPRRAGSGRLARARVRAQTRVRTSYSERENAGERDMLPGREGGRLAPGTGACE